jgi:hypothetical protein
MKYTVYCEIFELEDDDDGDVGDSRPFGFELETDENPSIVLKELLRKHKGITGFCT